MSEITAYALSRRHLPGVIEAEVVVTEANGDEYLVSCTCRADGTTIDGDGPALAYLNERYGDVQFCTTVRQAAMGDEEL